MDDRDLKHDEILESPAPGSLTTPAPYFAVSSGPNTAQTNSKPPPLLPKTANLIARHTQPQTPSTASSGWAMVDIYNTPATGKGFASLQKLP